MFCLQNCCFYSLTIFPFNFTVKILEIKIKNLSTTQHPRNKKLYYLACEVSFNPDDCIIRL